jgi:isochorismate synthase EntC
MKILDKKEVQIYNSFSEKRVIKEHRLKELLHDIEHFFEECSTQKNVSQVIRFETNIPSLDLIDWLSYSAASFKFYWKNRTNTHKVACVHSIYTHKSNKANRSKKTFTTVNKLIKSSPRLKVISGLAFNQNQRLPKHWKEYGLSMTTIPLIEIEQKDDTTTLSVNLFPTIDKQEQSHLLKKIKQACTFSDITKKAHSFKTNPKFASQSNSIHSWKDMINTAQSKIKQNSIKKLVLATETIYTTTAMDSPERVLPLFKSSANTIDFYLQPTKGSAFFGRSPEILYQRNK